MTTKADWEFRAEYLRDHARYLRQQAAEFEKSADEYDCLCRKCTERLVAAHDDHLQKWIDRA